MNEILKVVILLLCVNWSFGANILHVSAVPSPSHGIWNVAISAELTQRGHNVTFLGLEESSTLKTNFTYISLKDIIDVEYDFLVFTTCKSYSVMFYMQEWCLETCKKIMKTEGLKTLLEYPKNFKFDLIIIDITSGSCLYPLIHRFNYPPTVAVTPFLLPTYASYNFGNHFHSTYVPWYGLPYTNNMSFLERVQNVIYAHLDTWLRFVSQFRQEHKIAKTVFGGDIPSMEKLERHISLLLANTDPILNYPQSLAPNIISVGGLHTRRAKQLPQDLQSIMDDAKNGVILFSLGTNVRSDQLSIKIREALLEAFSQLPETVIWKFESELENLPKNVIIRKWLPQNDILGHPNLRLFIGHGGSLSTQESIFHGVPIICIPFMVDQHINAKNIFDKKLGLFMDFHLITKNYVLRNVREVLDNPIYLTNIRKSSEIFRDRSETPLQRGVFWIEYALRHEGADFLNTPVRDFPFYKSTGLDIIVFLLIITIIVLVLLGKLCKFFVNLFHRNNKVKMN